MVLSCVAVLLLGGTLLNQPQQGSVPPDPTPLVRRLAATAQLAAQEYRVGIVDGRIVSPADNRRLNGVLEAAGYEVIAVDIDQFARCGGGVHCLTMPLARIPA